MGFSDIRSRKALLATDGGSLEVCISWISEHQEDPDIDDPIQFVDMSVCTSTGFIWCNISFSIVLEKERVNHR